MRSSGKSRLVITCLLLFSVTFIFAYLSKNSEAFSQQAQSQADNIAQSAPSREQVVLFNGRLAADEESMHFEVPSGSSLLITDAVVQNRAPGDNPVAELAFSRLFLGPFLANNGQSRIEQDIGLTVVGNNTLNLHFTTGMQVSGTFRISNAINSTAPFVEYTITGILSKR